VTEKRCYDYTTPTMTSLPNKTKTRKNNAYKKGYKQQNMM
jgi:hypothetical protein